MYTSAAHKQFRIILDSELKFRYYVVKHKVDVGRC